MAVFSPLLKAPARALQEPQRVTTLFRGTIVKMKLGLLQRTEYLTVLNEDGDWKVQEF